MDLNHVAGIAAHLCNAHGWGAPEYIDNGASAAVYRTCLPSGPAALKIYDPTFFIGSDALIEENRIALQVHLKGHGCSQLIDVIDAGRISQFNTWYLLMEFCPWKSLEKRIQDVPDSKVHVLIKKLVSAVKFLESKDLVHRDIKPANIVVSEDFDDLRLLDFGVIRSVTHDEGSGTDGDRFIATAQYSPPEFLIREEDRGPKGFAAINIYQIGAVLHDMITKNALFSAEKSTNNKFKLFKAVTEKIPRIVSDGVPPRLIALCIASLDKNPASRVSSVSLDDFMADADDLDTLRRRVSTNNSGKKSDLRPTMAAWQPIVRSWGHEAAQLETESLGAVTMKAIKLVEGILWKLSFSGASSPIYLKIARDGNSLLVYVLATVDEVASPIFEIGGSGATLPETGIPGTLAAQYLYALDRALAAAANAAPPKAVETARE